jgi:hypothetical protein
MSGALHGLGNLALVFRAELGFSARFYFHGKCKKLAKEFRFLPINSSGVFGAEEALCHRCLNLRAVAKQILQQL